MIRKKSFELNNENDQGYDENDREQVEKGLSSTAIKELDLDLAKLARWACLAFFFIFVFLYLSQSKDFRS